MLLSNYNSSSTNYVAVEFLILEIKLFNWFTDECCWDLFSLMPDMSFIIIGVKLSAVFVLLKFEKLNFFYGKLELPPPR